MKTAREYFCMNYDNAYDYAHINFDDCALFGHFLEDEHIAWDGITPGHLSYITDEELLEKYKAYIRNALINQRGWEEEDFTNGYFELACLQEYIDSTCLDYVKVEGCDD